MNRNHIHFVGFKDDRYWNAVKVWGLPDFYHRVWDVRARQEVSPGDVVIFAREKDYDNWDNPSKWTFDDSSVF
jgi:hypothetical protein